MSDIRTIQTIEATMLSPDLSAWSYETAFSRNLGLISHEEQNRLRNCRVAIAGLGGVGGVHLTALARLGIGNFSLADPDTFEAANFNRQYGATLANLGRPKADVMAEVAAEINPEVDLRVLNQRVSPRNVEAFLDGVDVLLDGVDFFCIEARRMLFAAARRLGIWAVTAGPIGFSTACLSFDPAGMSFDRYFDIHDRQTRKEQLIAFAVGLAPRATQRAYTDLRFVDVEQQTGPSASLACQLASGVAAAETLKIVLGRGRVRPAPWYFQFDAYHQVFRHGRLWLGNRHPLQRLKRRWLARRFSSRSAGPRREAN